jgi:hypothetical protein
MCWWRVSTPPEHPGRDQGGKEVKVAVAVLTLGRRCSRGRLGVVVPSSGVGVPGGDAPSAPAPWTRTAPASTARLLPSWQHRLWSTNNTPVSSARRGRRRGPSSPLPSPFSPSPSLGSGTGERGKPQVVGGEPAGAWPQGVDARSLAAQGQRCLSASGLGARVRRATWPHSNGRRSS